MADISPNTDQMENGDPPEGRKSRAEVLFVSDTEMFRRIGISEKIGRIAVRELEKRLVFLNTQRSFIRQQALLARR